MAAPSSCQGSCLLHTWGSEAAATAVIVVGMGALRPREKAAGRTASFVELTAGDALVL